MTVAWQKKIVKQRLYNMNTHVIASERMKFIVSWYIITNYFETPGFVNTLVKNDWLVSGNFTHDIRSDNKSNTKLIVFSF